MRGAVKRSGFTLIEILITLVILSTGIVLVLEAFQTSLTALGASRDSLWSNVLIKEKLAGIEADELEDDDFEISDSSGNFDDPYRKYAWKMDVASINVSSSTGESAGSLRELTITAWRRGMKRSETLSTYKREKGGGKK